MSTTGLARTDRAIATTESSGLAERDEFALEASTVREAALARHEIEGSLVMAKRFPRNEDECFRRLMRSCKRRGLAERAEYSFPRGNTTVVGPTIYLLREAARIWGNIRFGADVIRDDDESRTLRCWAWDLESNARSSQDVTFGKLVQRKQRGGETAWVKPDERDLRELTNKFAAVTLRSCLRDVLPSDLIDDARGEAYETLRSEAAKNPDEERKRLIYAFDRLNVSVPELERHLGHAVGTCSPEELANLRRIWKSIEDGASRWADYVTDSVGRETGKIDPVQLTPSAAANRGHGGDNLDAIPRNGSGSRAKSNDTNSDTPPAEELSEADRRAKEDWEALKGDAAKA